MTIDRFDSGQSRTGFERVDGSDIQAHIWQRKLRRLGLQSHGPLSTLVWSRESRIFPELAQHWISSSIRYYMLLELRLCMARKWVFLVVAISSFRYFYRFAASIRVILVCQLEDFRKVDY
jgi:hypothetical protein